MQTLCGCRITLMLWRNHLFIMNCHRCAGQPSCNPMQDGGGHEDGKPQDGKNQKCQRNNV